MISFDDKARTSGEKMAIKAIKNFRKYDWYKQNLESRYIPLPKFIFERLELEYCVSITDEATGELLGPS